MALPMEGTATVGDDKLEEEPDAVMEVVEVIDMARVGGKKVD
jgi:hypothetical protein